MKQKIFFTFLASIVLLAGLFLITSEFANAAPLDVIFEQNPFPSHAGEQVVLSFHVTNNGNTNLTSVTFSLDVNDPLILRSAKEKTVSLQVGESNTTSYNVYVQEDADEGKETITLTYDVNGNSYDEDFDVQIASNQVFLQVEQVTSNPESVAPGSSVIIIIQVKNTANSEVKDVVLGLDVSNLPFAPESVTEQRIGSIGDGSKSSVSFNLIALSTANIAVYKIPLTLTYYDIYGNKYQRQDVVSVNVFETPDIDLLLDKNSLIIGLSSNISVKVLNKGLGKVNFVALTVIPSSDYDIKGTSYIYVGSVESDDYSSVDFMLTPKAKENVITFNLEYRDVNNKKYVITKTLDVNAYTAQEAQRIGLLPGFPWFTIIIILVIIVLIIFFISRRRKKRKKLMS
ncbi:MAG: hypothetical protein NTX24_01785 [Candidatus Pacearchaeota archaeon]|nr:hypothetical protein [Candidatus Pacearchaeota archaeon]